MTDHIKLPIDPTVKREWEVGEKDSGRFRLILELLTPQECKAVILVLLNSPMGMNDD